MLNRIKQVLFALSAKITEKDHRLLCRYLSSMEQNLFYTMDIPTQFHSVRVARTALSLKANYSSVDEYTLLKGALLHDIGKPAGHLTTILRSLIVLINRFNPNLALNLARPGRGNWWDNLRHGFYIQFQHPALGAEIASKAGVAPQVIYLIENHHRPAGVDDTIELNILREADNLN